MNIDVQNIIQQIKSSDSTVINSSIRNLFSILKPGFCKFNLMPGHRLLFRVRSHTEGDGNYFFNNLKELNYRTDYFNIKKYGRCNEPFQSMFYCADDEMLSFAEVSEIVRTENKKETAYHTTSVWKINKPLLVTTIFEPDNAEINNKDLVEITKNCIEQIDTTSYPIEKENLKHLLKLVATEFTKPFSLDKDAYLFSSAVTNYFLDTIGFENEKIDGIVYPTCIGESKIRNIGLNHVFRTNIVGFENKIEFVDAYRSRMDKKGFEYYESERITLKVANKSTGEIIWSKK
jgi:hypothetical protein